MLYDERIGPRLAIALGVYLSLKIDLPTGATIVCTFGVALILMALLRDVVRRSLASVYGHAHGDAKPPIEMPAERNNRAISSG